jgi:hypothetical protein
LLAVKERQSRKAEKLHLSETAGASLFREQA